MNFEDEPYVRLYTTDTATWVLLGWEGQTVLLHMLRGKFDRAGLFSCGRHEPSQAVTAVTRLPSEVVEAGVAALLAEGVWVFEGGSLVWPNYLHAQTCARSDRLRQAESRKNRRNAALPVITPKAESASQNVTTGHEMSQPSQSVTLSLALPSLALDPPKPPRGRRARRVKAPETELPIDWAPTSEHKARASRDGLNLVREADRFRSHAESKGVTALNWNARFTTWLINALDYRERDGRAPAQQTTPAKPVVMLADMTPEQKEAYKQRERDLSALAREQTLKQIAAHEAREAALANRYNSSEKGI